MQKRPLGSSGLQVPIITLGTMTWGQQNTEIEAHEQLDYAVNERGLNFIDTAEIYPVPPEKSKQGRTETYIGNWLKKRGKRDDLIITSKVAVAPGLIQTREQGELSRLDRKNIRTAVEGSLERLQTDYIDLYQVHWPERSTNFFGVRGVQSIEDEDTTSIEDTLTALAELQKEGKIKHIGISNETPWGVNEYLRLAREKNLPKIVSIQNQYSLTNRTYEIGLSEITMRENVAMLAYSVLNMGVLTGKYLDGAKPAGARFTLFERNSERYNSPHSQEATKQYVELAKEHGLDPSTMAIAFACAQPFITSVIIGATSMEQLKVCIDAGEVTLSQEVLDGIAAIHTNMPDMTH